MPTADELAVVGRIRKAHGIRGELIVEPYTNEPAAVFAAGRRLIGGLPDGRPLPQGLALTVRRATPHKEGWIVRVDEVADRTAAEGWRDRTLLAPLAELPPPGADEVYLHDLVGLRVVRADGTAVGEVADYYELPHGIMLEVRLAGRADTVLVPYRPEIVTEVDTGARTLTIDPPEGLLE
ncbi:ribosome maturation factor RimM [Roseisolibacter sp. H3M3-2]|uniref:ribosome maturation factor RimM n=1 Tax=Roseisolibacter sp. H3M3-2 TaxID=3031323 RepID=UPI0023DCCE8D|nr:ribosome maturation factor RimM [Roseisolibacter sp. H3M3-2]MDF1501895.1 ribosome maturation factor RimM [Roseisolibacter sp. H3M3-2]